MIISTKIDAQVLRKTSLVCRRNVNFNFYLDPMRGISTYYTDIKHSTDTGMINIIERFVFHKIIVKIIIKKDKRL